MSIAIVHGSTMTDVAKKELAMAIDVALADQKEKSEDRGFRKALGQRRTIW
mgnify:FL=1